MSSGVCPGVGGDWVGVGGREHGTRSSPQVPSSLLGNLFFPASLNLNDSRCTYCVPSFGPLSERPESFPARFPALTEWGDLLRFSQNPEPLEYSGQGLLSFYVHILSYLQTSWGQTVGRGRRFLESLSVLKLLHRVRGLLLGLG